MDIESGEDDDLGFEPLQQRTEKALTLSREAESVAERIYSKREKKVLIGQKIDPDNRAQKSYSTMRTREFGEFDHFLTKNKNRASKAQIFEILREFAESKQYSLIGRVGDKLERSRMILRVISKEKDGLVMVQDDTGKDKMLVRYGTVWVGMIALMEVTYIDNAFKLEMILNLGEKIDWPNLSFQDPKSAYRLLFVKGAFLNCDSMDNIGLKVLTSELKKLREKERSRVNGVVIMGPLINSNHELIVNSIEKTYEEEAMDQIKMIKDEIHKISDDIEIIFMPATDDLTTYYPIPQPKHNFFSPSFKNVRFTSNPGTILLSSGLNKNVVIDMMNIDLLHYIDENRTGMAQKSILQDNLETYLKQPFILTNTEEEPFDETNLPGLYNSGKFADIIVTSSRKNPPFATEISGKMFVNVGSLGVDKENYTNKHYMTLISVYEGTGPVGLRTKVESISM